MCKFYPQMGKSDHLQMYPAFLYVEPEQDHIAVLNHIFFSFHTDQTFFSGSGVRTGIQQVLIIDYFCFDEPTFEVRMDLSCRLRCLGAVSDGPCPALICSGTTEASTRV